MPESGGAISSPRLSKLILVRCSHIVRPGQDTSSFHSYERHLEYVPSVIRLISTLCPDLMTFHFSVSRRFYPELSRHEVVTVATSFQHTEELNLLDKDFGPFLLKDLSTAVINHITTLNLLPSYSTTILKSDIPLRKILCTFKHLVHLRAPRAAYFVDEMDLHDVQEQLRDHWNPKPRRSSHRMDRLNPRIPSDDPVAARQYVWACRGLRTLHMGVTCRDSDAELEELSLIIFGFLSRMCPRLRDLQLRMWNTTLTLSGGLSLLTRLQDLERVVIAMDYYPMMKEGNLFWLSSTPPSILDRLGYPLLRRKALQKHRKRFRLLPPAKVTTAESKLVERGQELGIDLSKIGYPEDLMEWMKEYYKPSSSSSSSFSSSTLPLPKLRTFWIEYPGSRRDGIVEKLHEFVTKIRPEVDIRLCKIPQDVYFTSTVKCL
ncbi:hypothetical protein BGZ95_007166 [Linnemannia exigua]|uniref:Uncharacterized protein n=1 Tax=Linnemannia exigua TaxID=604196 RepID=A0AAD4DFQ3_9FUNG|nr:hypothetical protein BGZ95_007166 [Linnemannia exigua]